MLATLDKHAFVLEILGIPKPWHIFITLINAKKLGKYFYFKPQDNSSAFTIFNRNIINAIDVKGMRGVRIITTTTMFNTTYIDIDYYFISHKELIKIVPWGYILQNNKNNKFTIYMFEGFVATVAESIRFNYL